MEEGGKSGLIQVGHLDNHTHSLPTRLTTAGPNSPRDFTLGHKHHLTPQLATPSSKPTLDPHMGPHWQVLPHAQLLTVSLLSSVSSLRSPPSEILQAGGEPQLKLTLDVAVFKYGVTTFCGRSTEHRLEGAMTEPPGTRCAPEMTPQTVQGTRVSVNTCHRHCKAEDRNSCHSAALCRHQNGSFEGASLSWFNPHQTPLPE